VSADSLFVPGAARGVLISDQRIWDATDSTHLDIGYTISVPYDASPAHEAFMSFNGPYMEDYLTYILKKMIDGIIPTVNRAGR
jgi:hypothetical protein